MCIRTIEYICVAQCSNECLKNNPNNFKTNCCKKLKTYNECNECNVYVCKDCYQQLHESDITYCLICRKINTSEDIELLQVIQNDVNRTDKLNNCFENTIDKLNNCFENTIDKLTDYFKMLYYLETEVGCCRKMCYLLGLICIPLAVSFLILLNSTNGDILNEKIPDYSTLTLATFIWLMWCIGALIIILIFCLIQVIRGKIEC